MAVVLEYGLYQVIG